jgi:hypothetical protein
MYQAETVGQVRCLKTGTKRNLTRRREDTKKTWDGRARHSVRAVPGFTTNDDEQKLVGLLDSYDGVHGSARPTQNAACTGVLALAPRHSARGTSQCFAPGEVAGMAPDLMGQARVRRPGDRNGFQASLGLLTCVRGGRI